MLLLLSMTVLRFGSWNVCGLAGEAGVAHVIQDFEKYQLTVLGIQGVTNPSCLTRSGAGGTEDMASLSTVTSRGTLSLSSKSVNEWLI